MNIKTMRHCLAPADAADGDGRPALRQVASVYRHHVGRMLVTALHDGHNPLALTDAFIPAATLDEVQRELRAACLPEDTLNIPFTPILLETGGELVLIDTGFGDGGPPTAGQMRSNLGAAGYRPEDIGKIVLSHFHRDHINGLRAQSGALNFPNAQILVPDVEWSFWTDASNREAAPEGLRGNFDNVARVLGPEADKVRGFAWGDEVVPGVTALKADGHTPGHTAFVMHSEGARLVFLADTTNHPALFVRNPYWCPAFDMDPQQARATRLEILGMIADERLPCAGYHIPFPGIGHVSRDGARFRFHPAQWMGVVR